MSAIGLHSREIIADDQFTASSSYSSEHAPSAARINNDAGVSSFLQTGSGVDLS